MSTATVMPYSGTALHRSNTHARREIRFSSYYDAAATTPNSDFGSWLNTLSDFNFNGYVRQIVLSRLRREVENNPYLAGLVERFPEAIGLSNLRSRTGDAEYDLAKETFWKAWTEGVDDLGCGLVTTDGHTLAELESLIRSEMLLAGELFLVKLSSGKVQIVPSEFCGSPHQGMRDGEMNGIIYRNGKPTAYRFGVVTEFGAIQFNREPIPARHVIHVFRRNRVRMGRGVPGLIACLKPAHDLHEITTAKTKQIKDAASISGTIEMEGAAEKIEGWQKDGPGEESTAETGDAPADRSLSTAQQVIELKPGQFIALEPGERLNMLKSEYGATDYKELVMLMLHAISAPVGLPVELWFSGIGNINFSGFKGLGTQWSNRRKRYALWEQRAYLDALHLWRVGLARPRGELTLPVPEVGEKVDWAWRKTAVLDDEREAKANKVYLDTGEKDLAEIWEDKGLYTEEVFKKRRMIWIKMLIAAGELEPGGNHDEVIVPHCFLLRGLLPEETKVIRDTETPNLDKNENDQYANN